MDQRNKHLKHIRRACTNVEVRRLIITAIKSGARYRLTKSGVMFYGEDGRSTVTHFTISDRRGANNLRAEFRRMGIEVSDSK